MVAAQTLAASVGPIPSTEPGRSEVVDAVSVTALRCVPEQPGRNPAKAQRVDVGDVHVDVVHDQTLRIKPA